MGTEYASSLTVYNAFEKGVRIKKVVNDKGLQYAIAIMVKLLSDTMMFVKNSLTAEQLSGYANMFISGNPTLTIDEIVIILTKGINGEYGQIYGNFDYTVLMDWRSQYEGGARADYLEKKHQVSERDEPRTSSTGLGIGAIIKDQIGKRNKPNNNS